MSRTVRLQHGFSSRLSESPACCRRRSSNLDETGHGPAPIKDTQDDHCLARSSLTPPNPANASTIELRSPRRHLETREEFCRWLKRVLRDAAARPSDCSIAAAIPACYPQFWEMAFDGVGRFCPERRAELETTARALLQSVDGSEETRQSWEQFEANLRRLYAATASPAERDADRLEEYLSNFSTRGQKAMVAELWTKGSATFQRLAVVRAANAPSRPMPTEVRWIVWSEKAELLWAKERQIRITKCDSGLVLLKHDLKQQEAESLPPT